ncbi:hypothetical protein EEK96_01065 [Escherichia coli]|nr:hypothetical protein [Escherichia coli]EFN7880166.1 hypothetical protein [Escherichia coli]
MCEKECFVHAGCGVNALFGLQNFANSVHCRSRVGLISVAHQAVLLLSSTRLFFNRFPPVTLDR